MRTIFAAACAAGFMVSPVLAESDLKAYCEGFTTQTGGDPSGCACLADSADAAISDELMAVESEADLEMLSQASKDAIAACWPDA
ncbi:hypothetical protein [Hyphococcus sp.]|uniref:hypothetical protein n=1 Tax=Hyphococcus sp. TaxID=2038636 RepID=UPI003CCBF3DC